MPRVWSRRRSRRFVWKRQDNDLHKPCEPLQSGAGSMRAEYQVMGSWAAVDRRKIMAGSLSLPVHADEWLVSVKGVCVCVCVVVKVQQAAVNEGWRSAAWEGICFPSNLLLSPFLLHLFVFTIVCFLYANERSHIDLASGFHVAMTTTYKLQSALKRSTFILLSLWSSQEISIPGESKCGFGKSVFGWGCLNRKQAFVFPTT